MEGAGPVGCGFAGAVEVVGADVEAFPVGGGGGDGGEEGEGVGEGLHLGGRANKLGWVLDCNDCV